VTMVWVVGRN